MRRLIWILAIGIVYSCVVLAKNQSIRINMVQLGKTKRQNVAIGYVLASQRKGGVLFEPYLHHLSPGEHGFHLHQKPSCGKKGELAKGHFDPAKTKKHLGPYNAAGHLGDLPRLVVNHDGVSRQAVFAPRLRLSQLHSHALMIHQGADNYSDQPKPNGGGGARVACGVIK